MSQLIKVTFTSTSGEETTGFATLLKNDIVELPKRMALRVSTAADAGEGYVLVAQYKGKAAPMIHIAGPSYQLDKKHAISDPWTKRVAESFRDPNTDQSQAYGRYCHTLSAAAVVGLVGYAAGRSTWSITVVLNCACLAVLAAVLLVTGATFLKGDK
ncbi:hypothetical protein [Cupriavidus pampae]|uniref:Uncharacterized protein n=1 Tax=Cupriavidus pampae TaxID=659251 RepID=A0ABM8XZ52_9BURK|nr:hypothetical protein [Cupriavidus pampae]CAG9185741.1 hypothetical protein LMG32289_06084 [Cupriavidus pampae]